MAQFPTWSLRLQARYAGDIRISGTTTDTDWNRAGAKSDCSESDSDADVEIWDADIVGLVRPFAAMRSRFLRTLSVGMVAGFGSQSFDFSETDLDAVYDFGTRRFTVPGPVAIYKVQFQGARVGLFSGIQPVRALSITAEVIWTPVVQAESEAVWILRNYPFWQEATGTGVSLDLKVNFVPVRQLRLFVGGRFVNIYTWDGTETGIVDGEDYYEDEPIVPEIRAQYLGAEAGLAIAF